MVEVGHIADKVRSKNAGPFWLTIDIFCPDAAAFQRLVQGLTDEQVAAALGCDVAELRRFDIEALNVIKFSLPRPQIQGSIHDRDIHGASWAVLVAGLTVEEK